MQTTHEHVHVHLKEERCQAKKQTNLTDPKAYYSQECVGAPQMELQIINMFWNNSQQLHRQYFKMNMLYQITVNRVLFLFWRK